MAAREPVGMRKAVLAGAVTLALTGTGAALAWSATGTPVPSPSQSAQGQQETPGKGSAPGQQNKPGWQDKQDKKAQRGQPLHEEGVVKNPDGTFQTVLEQRGTVESVNDSAITVKSEDGFTQTYTVNADTRVIKFPAPAANGTGSPASPGNSASPGSSASPGDAGPGATGDDGKRLRPMDGTIADIATGDTIRIAGVKDGDKATAKRIVKGVGDRPGLGLGGGLGRGPGHGLGLGHKMDKGNHQDDQES